MTASTVGKFDHYSEEHQKFLTSGYICPNCEETLMNWWGVADVECYSSTGEKVSLAMARLKGKEFSCPLCGHRWSFRAKP